MTKQKIKDLARQAQLPHTYLTDEPLWLDKLEVFAALVAEKEREACAKRLDAVGATHCAENIRARGQE